MTVGPPTPPAPAPADPLPVRERPGRRLDPARPGHPAPRRPQALGAALAAWPPPGATETDLTGAYDRLAAQGYAYGPAFRNLRRLWSAGNDLYAEVALDAEQRTHAGRFAVHRPCSTPPCTPCCPVCGRGRTVAAAVRLGRRPGPCHRRHRPAGAAHLPHRRHTVVALTIADDTGTPLATVGELTLRPLTADALTAAVPQADGLLRVDWTRCPPRRQTVRPTAGRCSAHPTGSVRKATP
ncbi:polyketide synthase dehydratase domain-containing protein [Streptomyces diastatochromogenes]|nr:polyketide synthase dehydratase domain-containing protein [Streptomyces diastatochromogenes]